MHFELSVKCTALISGHKRPSNFMISEMYCKIYEMYCKNFKCDFESFADNSLTTIRPLLSLPHHRTLSQTDTLPPILPLFNPDRCSTSQTAAFPPRPPLYLPDHGSLSQAVALPLRPTQA